MGNDGGSIQRRDELVRARTVPEKADPELVRQALWTLCTLSRQLLRPPIVSCSLGRLYNKDALVQYLLDRNERTKGGYDDIVAGHIRGLKDVVQLQLTNNPEYKPPSPTSSSSDPLASQFICPLTSKQMNGKYRFVYISKCGCVMSESGLRAVCLESSDKSTDLRKCPVCGTEFHANALAKGKGAAEVGGEVVFINPLKTEQDEMRKQMETTRALEAEKKKQAKAAKNTNSATQDDNDEKKRKKTEKKAAREAKVAALMAELAKDGQDGDIIRSLAMDDPEDDDASTPARKRARLAETTRPSMSTAAPGVLAAIKVAEHTRQNGSHERKPISAAIASLYGPSKNGRV